MDYKHRGKTNWPNHRVQHTRQTRAAFWKKNWPSGAFAGSADP
jgi:hypothetical protein